MHSMLVRFSCVFFLLVSLWVPLWASAATIELGKPLPPVVISDRGELLLVDGKPQYPSWNSSSLHGKLVVLQHMAARLTAKSQMQAFNDEMEKRAYPPERVLVAVVVNLDDALWGTTGLVESELTGNKKKHPQSNIVPDKNGVARSAWQLEEKSAALVLLDTDGTVLFFKQGKPTRAERNRVFQLIEQRLAPASADAVSVKAGAAP